MDRGRYAGPVGWMDAAGDGEWGIALRCGVFDSVDPRRMRLFAGCGIVAGSDPDSELAESDAKFVPMRDALTASGPRQRPSVGGGNVLQSAKRQAQAIASCTMPTVRTVFLHGAGRAGR